MRFPQDNDGEAPEQPANADCTDGSGRPGRASKRRRCELPVPRAAWLLAPDPDLQSACVRVCVVRRRGSGGPTALEPSVRPPSACSPSLLTQLPAPTRASGLFYAAGSAGLVGRWMWHPVALAGPGRWPHGIACIACMARPSVCSCAEQDVPGATQCDVLQRSATCCSIVRGMGVQLCRTRSTCPRAVRLRKVRHSPILSSIIYKSSQSVSVIAHRRAHAGRDASLSLSYENYHWCHALAARGANTVMAGNSVPTASGIASQRGYRAGVGCRSRGGEAAGAGRARASRRAAARLARVPLHRAPCCGRAWTTPRRARSDPWTTSETSRSF